MHAFGGANNNVDNDPVVNLIYYFPWSDYYAGFNWEQTGVDDNNQE